MTNQSNGDIERKIEEALMRHSEDATTKQGQWSSIERSIQSGRRMRAVGGSILAVAALIAAAIFVPKALHNKRSAQPVPPAGITSSTPPPAESSIPANWTLFRDVRMGYWTAMPNDWKSSMFEGHVELRPAALHSGAEGGDTFTVDTWSTGDVPTPGPNAKPVTVAGHAATREETVTPDGAHTITYEFLVWGCGALAPTCPPTGMLATIYASNQALWDQYGNDGIRVIEHLHSTDLIKDEMPSKPFRTVNGSACQCNAADLTAGFAADSYADLVVAFLENRVLGDEARGFLSSEALAAYTAHRDRLDLYLPGGNLGLQSYKIVERRTVSGGAEFDVLLAEYSPAGKAKPDPKAQETLTVGRGANYKGELVGGGAGVVILFASRAA